MRYTTLNDTQWLEIAAKVSTRRSLLLQVAATSSAVYISVGTSQPDVANAFILSALDVLDLVNAGVIGPIHIKAATGGIASVVVMEG